MTNKEFFIQTWQAEMKRTLSAVKGLPADMEKLNYKCDEKARSAADIIGHILPHAEALSNAVDSFIAIEQTGKKYESVEAAALYFEKYATLLAEKLKAVNDTQWEQQIVEFHLNGNILFAGLFNGNETVNCIAKSLSMR